MIKTTHVFVAFVKDNATMSSIRYFKNHVEIHRILCKTEELDPIKLIFLRQISLSIAFKYIINNSV